MENPSLMVVKSVGSSKQPSDHAPLLSVRNLALAGIGIAGVLGDEAQNLYQRSVERGECMVKRLQGRLPRARQHRSGQSVHEANQQPRQTSARLDAALAGWNIPTSADIQALTRQISELEAKIDSLES